MVYRPGNVVVAGTANGPVISFPSNELHTNFHMRSVNAILLHPTNATQLVSGSDDAVVKSWEYTTTGNPTVASYGAAAPISALAPRPGSTELALCFGQAVTRWNLQYPDVPPSSIGVHAGSRVVAAQFRPTAAADELLTAAADTTILLWNASLTSVTLQTYTSTFVQAAAAVQWLSDGVRFLVGGDNYVILFDRNGTNVSRFQCTQNTTNLVTSLALHPAGTEFLVGHQTGDVCRFGVPAAPGGPSPSPAPSPAPPPANPPAAAPPVPPRASLGTPAIIAIVLGSAVAVGAAGLLFKLKLCASLLSSANAAANKRQTDAAHAAQVAQMQAELDAYEAARWDGYDDADQPIDDDALPTISFDEATPTVGAGEY